MADNSLENGGVGILAEESEEERDNSGDGKEVKGGGKRRATLLSRLTIEGKGRTSTQQQGQEESEELSEELSEGGRRAPRTHQEDEPTFNLVSHNRSRDRPYDPQGEALTLAGFLAQLGNPQSAMGLIHLMKSQPILIAPYIQVMKAATATGAETQDCLFARYVNNMFIHKPNSNA